MLELRVLGDLVVLRDGALQALPPSKKTRALLAYLAVVDRPQRRERLCEMFWEIPDDPRGALRWSLSKIRQITDGGDDQVLMADRNFVSLDHSRINLDAGPLLGLDPRELEHLETGRLEHLAECFRGLFLDDLALPRCPEYEAWRVAVANELEVTRLRLLRLLVDRLADDPTRALAHAHALHALEPEDAALRGEIARLSEAARHAALSQGLASAGPVPRSPIAVPAADNVRLVQEIRHCSTPDGTRLAYALSGSGFPIVRAAHWMSHLELDWESPIWRHWTEAMSAQNTFVRYDQRGNGLSERNVTDVSFDTMVADLEGVVDAAGFRRFFLLGISQGAAVSIAYAVRHPERVAGLILYGGFAKGWRKRGDAEEFVRRQALGALMREGWGRADAAFRQMFTALFVPEATPEQTNWYNELQRETVSGDVAHRIFEATSEIDVEDQLAKVRVPTLVMHARDDAVIPFSSGVDIARQVRGARFHELQSRNHILLAHEPAFAELVSHMRDFIAAPEATSSGTAAPVGAGLDRIRQNVTMLVAEIVSPMHVFEQADPEAAASALTPLQDRLLRAIESHDGLVLGALDGSVTAAFGLKSATEDHAYLACRAALAARSAIEDASGGAARLRVGIDTGDVIVAGTANPAATPTILGAAPRTASRVMRSLRRSTIALTARARTAAGGYVRTQVMAPEDHPLLGRDEKCHELIGENQALSRWHLRAHRGLTRLVGREVEMSLLRTAWRRVREGSGQIVGIVAEPGLGKSRLTHEFIAEPEVKGFDILEAGALEFESKAPLVVIKKLLLSALGVRTEDRLELARERLERRCRAIGLDDRLLPALQFLADMPVDDPAWGALDTSERRVRIAEAMRSLLTGISRQAPLVVLFEDLHWMDPESRAVLDRLAETVATCRILLLCTYRPSFAPNWSRRGSFHEIRLSHFLRSEIRACVDSLIGKTPELDELAELLTDQSEGSPLYLEEMVRSLVERKQLVGEPGSYRLNDRITAVEIPSGVQSLVAARINRLATADRQVLQLAAVIGRNVPMPLLSNLAPVGPLELVQALARLQAQEFLFEAQSFPHVEYMFKHAIIQRVTYDSILTEDRKRLHRNILAACERLYETSASHLVETLAEHAMRAEDWEAAARYAREAAARAEERSAYDAVLRFLEDARRALSRLPQTDEVLAASIDVATAMRPACGAIGEFGKAAAPLEEARQMAEQLGDRDRLYEVLLHQSYLNSTYGRFEEALEPAETMKRSAIRIGTPRCVAEADLAASQALLLQSRAEEAIERLAPHREGFLTEWRHERFGQMGTRSIWYLGHWAQSLARLGRFPEAEKAVAEVRELAEEVRRPLDRAAAVYFAGVVDLLRGPTGAAVDQMQKQAAEDQIAGGAFIRGWILPVLGHALLALGEADAACSILEDAVGLTQRVGMGQCELRARAVLACARSRLGMPEAHANLLHALGSTQAAGDAWSEVLVLRGLAQARPAMASDYLKKACAVSRLRNLRPELARSLKLLAEIPGKADAAARREAEALISEMGLRDLPTAPAEEDQPVVALTM